MKKILFLILIALRAMSQPVLKMTEISHDFGNITEGVNASHTFAVENAGSQPLIITNVRPSCGCTTPDWTKTPIAPGGKGFIMATFSSEGRPGVFNKIIVVETNNPEESKQLVIKGVVAPKSEKVYTEAEIKNSPVISLERSDYNFGKVQSGQMIHQKLNVTNKGKSSLKLSGVQSGCKCVEYSLKKNEIGIDETITLEIMYKPNGTGEQIDIVTLVSNDIVSKSPIIKLKANVVQGSGNILNLSSGSVPFK